MKQHTDVACGGFKIHHYKKGDCFWHWYLLRQLTIWILHFLWGHTKSSITITTTRSSCSEYHVLNKVVASMKKGFIFEHEAVYHQDKLLVISAGGCAYNYSSPSSAIMECWKNTTLSGFQAALHELCRNQCGIGYYTMVSAHTQIEVEAGPQGSTSL